MKRVDSRYRAPWWATSPHLQSVLASSPWRVARGARRLKAIGAVSQAHVLDAIESAVARRMEGLALAGDEFDADDTDDAAQA